MLDTNQLHFTNPLVSILIAARNEESTILTCLKAIDELDKPEGEVEVLIGNDLSTDRTAELVVEFIQERPAFKLLSITESNAGLRGKANVLAQLANYARGQYLFFTDADTQVPKSWLRAMIPYMVGQTGIVTGVTLPDGPTDFHKVQSLDWLYNLTLAHLLAGFGIPVTAMGNNMLVSRRAYEAVGGYASLPFSITEDYALFRAIVQRGFEFQNVLSEQVLAHTKPVDSWFAWLQQRKRWMHGAMELPVWIVFALHCQYLALPLLVVIGIVSPLVAVALYGIRLLIQSIVLSIGLSRLRQTKLGRYALLFEMYQLVMGPLAVIYYWLPTKIDWKGRKY
ncbi:MULTISPECIES: glycosyltransferase [unclassified Spirosoma]|uniref:glycosyltransferase n=1 Tax=unclassified Spirosoma TaxID=2621999 RepID=UPI0009668595|nr:MULTISPECIES: glycosyltransferase [unclassified Spirosoma]MBN8820604.1 glycosyltransferase [Spirosoma sp.]OJW71728.1 MAG: glycosyl transferase family 2 [Spirosoma sp. 48-14]